MAGGLATLLREDALEIWGGIKVASDNHVFLRDVQFPCAFSGERVGGTLVGLFAQVQGLD